MILLNAQTDESFRTLKIRNCLQDIPYPLYLPQERDRESQASDAIQTGQIEAVFIRKHLKGADLIADLIANLA
ncbi:hypothetical protein E4U19_007580 [Claviceps sp. Clav32 group G5]|nr:hypothetical protein E4U19_007580 [Claviceps sp. Clav32 group G5]KAG6041690.1 hypothetical protein E4U39_006410 [Claviceps sp. Clav50 group G5]